MHAIQSLRDRLLGMMAHICNPSIQEAEVKRSGGQDQSCVYNKFLEKSWQHENLSEEREREGKIKKGR